MQHDNARVARQLIEAVRLPSEAEAALQRAGRNNRAMARQLVEAVRSPRCRCPG